MEWIFNNKEWLFSGVGLAIILGLLKRIYPSKTENKNDSDLPYGESIPMEISSTDRAKLEQIKRLTNVLFIDDDTKFKIIKILNKAGWQARIIKDVDNLDSAVVQNSHILFVDINGVGVKLGFKDEGLGLAHALKKRYPEKKVIIYSTDSTGDRFHEALRSVDTFLSKNAEPLEFQELIEQYSLTLGLL